MIPADIVARIESADHVDRLGAAMELRRLSFDDDKNVVEAAIERLRLWNSREFDLRVKPFVDEILRLVEGKQKKISVKPHAQPDGWPPSDFVPQAALHACRQKIKDLRAEIEDLKSQNQKLRQDYINK